MISIHWIDNDSSKHRPFSQQRLSSLISSILEPVDPSPAFSETLRLAHLQLLSNHTNKAYELICALYKHAGDIVPSSARSPLPSSLPLERFWRAHRETHPFPENARSVRVGQLHQPRAAILLSDEWSRYRECCRTGWMLNQCKLAEPDDPHVWRETDDPTMLAMCARLLAKNNNSGAYPAQEQMCEALAAAKKLYAFLKSPSRSARLRAGREGIRTCCIGGW